jgi:hypothetical protein
MITGNVLYVGNASLQSNSHMAGEMIGLIAKSAIKKRRQLIERAALKLHVNIGKEKEQNGKLINQQANHCRIIRQYSGPLRTSWITWSFDRHLYSS